jgi:drug/metabolite transporter (DMT)-like permease
MNWHLFAFVAPALWAACNYIDKYLLTRHFKDANSTGVLMMVSGFVAGIAAIIVFLFGVDVAAPSLIYKLVMIGNGLMFIPAFLPYFIALREEDASIVIPIYQSIPVFGYFLGMIFLGEHLTATQVVAGLIIIGGAVGLSLDFSQKLALKTRPLLLMLLSSAILAAENLIFKAVALHETFWITSFWEYLGAGIFAVCMYAFGKNYRPGFLELFVRKQKVLGLLFLQELLSVGANMMASFALLLAPIAIVSVVVNGLQPFYVLVLGVLLTVFFPKQIQESLTKRALLQKVIFIVIIFLGTVLLGTS